MNRLSYHDQAITKSDNDSSNIVTSHWRPSVDIREEHDRFLITADVPGVDPKDIEITMDNGILSIKGERASQSLEEKRVINVSSV